jgi:hypothetical protein
MSAAAASKGALRAVGTFPDAEEAIGARSLRRSVRIRTAALLRARR